MEYRTPKECKYYGSDYNKFLAEECNHEMTVINLDVLQYKRSKNILRICEYKHQNESVPKSQSEVLKIIAKIFDKYNKFVPFGIKLEVYLIRGDWPFDSATIFDLINKTEKTVKKSELIKFAEFE